MATTPLSSIVARANKARLHVSTLGRTAFSDLGGLARSAPDTGGFAVGGGGGTLGGRGLDFGPDIEGLAVAHLGVDVEEAVGLVFSSINWVSTVWRKHQPRSASITALIVLALCATII
jgi:hypothetical protein